MKKLICESTIEALHEKGKTVVYIGPNTIVTPSAKDLMDKYNMEPCDQCEEKATTCCASSENPLDGENIYKAMKALVDQGMFKGMFDEAKDCGEKAPYCCEKDPKGFKVIRGKTVNFEVLETGVPADDGKVKYQETIGADDKSSVNAGFMTIDKCRFDWDVQCEEIYYVVEGEIKITLGNNTYVAKQGDSLFIPKGSQVVFEAEDHVKVFYATY